MITQPLQKTRSTKTNTIFMFTLFGVALLFMLGYGLGDAFRPLLLSFILAYLLRPMTLKLESWGLPRVISVLLVFFVALTLITLFFIFVIPMLIRELKDLLYALPAQIDTLFAHLEEIAQKYDVTLPIHRDDVRELLKQSLPGSSLDIFNMASPILRNTFSSLLQIVLMVLNLALIPLFFAYLVHSYESIGTGLNDLLPPRFRPRLRALSRRVHEILSGYLLGQSLAALILAAFYGIGLLVVHLKFGFIVGVCTGLLVIVPYVGYGTGLLTAMVIELSGFSSWSHVFSVLMIFALGQALESFVVTPRLVGHKVGLHPLTTILALIVGGNMFGFLGLLIAVPAAAVLQEASKMLRVEYQRSSFFLD